MRFAIFAIFICFSATVTAQLTLTTKSGSFIDADGAEVSVGSEVNSLGFSSASGSGSFPGSSSFTLSNRAFTDPYTFQARSVVAFRAQTTSAGNSGDAVDFQLPSNRTGGISISSDGDSVMYGITATDYAGALNNYSLSGSVSASGTAEANIWMETSNIGRGSARTVSLDSGTYSATSLDNGAWDLDPTVGNVLINREFTPSIVLNYNVPIYTVQRDQIGLVGESWDNPFFDRFYAEIGFDMSNSTSSQFYSSNTTPNFVEFAPGDMSVKTLTGLSGSITLDMTIFDGNYRFSGSDLIWNWMGDTEGFPNNNYPATGDYNNYSSVNVTVVPEPASMVAISLGLAGLVSRRRNR